MAQFCIPLVADDNRSEHQEHKISSSSIREQRLGTLIHPVQVRNAWDLMLQNLERLFELCRNGDNSILELQNNV